MKTLNTTKRAIAMALIFTLMLSCTASFADGNQKTKVGESVVINETRTKNTEDELGSLMPLEEVSDDGSVSAKPADDGPVSIGSYETAMGRETLINGRNEAAVPLQSYEVNHAAEEGIAPFTGLPDAGNAFTPITITIDGNVESYPHWGVGDADIVLQVPNQGGGDTKLMFLFGNTYPDEVGPARSARATMVPVAAMFNAAYVYAGQAPVKGHNIEAESLMRDYGIRGTGKSFNLLNNPHLSERVTFAVSPVNLSVHLSKVRDELITGGVSFTKFPFLFTDEPRTNGDSATWIKLKHYGEQKKESDNKKSRASFYYDAGRGGYLHLNNRDEVDTERMTGEKILFSNVIILRTPLKYQQYGENIYVYYATHLIGSGAAEIFQNGRYVQGAWSRETGTSRLVLVDEDGQELKMQRGRTFIIITNSVTDVFYRE